MIDITISRQLKETWPEIALGCIEAQVAVTESNELLWSDITNYCTELKQEVSIEVLASLPRIFYSYTSNLLSNYFFFDAITSKALSSGFSE
ncbi:hypothetical protein [Clostridium sp. C8-1-8]|uniref:hypothetical protein n=1 Tax=Clostridium sp. C8-1-8 TaxID=2698831 RepID=UPI001368EDB7|nr:hypothetical protein [Clostridium sp. C8-1-8]